MAHKASPVKDQGTLSSPNQKHGCTLPLATVNLVQAFYEFYDISQISCA